MRLWHGVVLALLLPLTGQVGTSGQLTQAEKNSLLSRKKWYVSYEFNLSGNGGQQGNSWRVSAQSDGTLELNFVTPGQFPLSTPPAETSDTSPGRFIGWMSVPSEETQRRMGAGETNPANLPGMYFPILFQTACQKIEPHGNETREHNWRGAGTMYGVGPCQLIFDLKRGTYDLLFTVGTTDLTGSITHSWSSPTSSGSDSAFLTHWTAWLPNPFNEQLLARKIRPELKQDGSLEFSLQGEIKDSRPIGLGPLTFRGRFKISPTPPSTAKLILEPADAAKYARWRPIPGRNDDDPGNSLDVKYTIEEPGVPRDQLTKVSKVTLRLGRVSEYPGVCMNFPMALSGSPKKDLRFKELVDTAGAHYSIGAQNETITITGAADAGAPRSGTVNVQCFDGAAIGEVVAEAELVDGRILTAEVRGQTASRKLLIPDRDEGVSDLAKQWRLKYADGLADSSDDETAPEGDGQPGDGLSVWEEYRGFRQGGVWRDNCDPKMKDLFIVNTIGSSALAGIQLFKNSTGLLVHHRLQQQEYASDRKINFNYRQDVHVVDQHFLFLTKSNNPSSGSCQPILGKNMGGPPKNTNRVDVVMGLPTDEIYGLRRNGQLIVQSQQNVMIAHELGHALGIWHHGECDIMREWKLDMLGGNHQIVEGSNIIKTVSEPAGLPFPMVQVFLAHGTNMRMNVWLGMPQGQHSGNNDCLMRYDTSVAYPHQTESQTRIWIGPVENTGENLCSSAAGTGVNSNTHQPQSRYGSADTQKSRGDCIHQFVVSDKWEAKDRL